MQPPPGPGPGFAADGVRSHRLCSETRLAPGTRPHLPGSISAHVCSTAKRWPGPAVWTAVSSQDTSVEALPRACRPAVREERVAGLAEDEVYANISPLTASVLGRGPGCGPQTDSAVLVQEGNFWKGVGGSRNHPGPEGQTWKTEPPGGAGEAWAQEPQLRPGCDVALPRAPCQSWERTVPTRAHPGSPGPCRWRGRALSPSASRPMLCALGPTGNGKPLQKKRKVKASFIRRQSPGQGSRAGDALHVPGGWALPAEAPARLRVPCVQEVPPV